MVLQYVIYTFYNLFAIVFALWVALFLNTYINEALIPRFLKANFLAEIIYRFLVVNVEIGFFIFLVYLINRGFVERYIKQKPNNLPYSTAQVTLALILIVTAISFYYIYQHDK